MSESKNKLVQLLEACWDDDDLKRRFISDPGAVMAERGIEVPEGIAFKVVENTDRCAHITLPRKLAGDQSTMNLAWGMGEYYHSLVCWVLDISTQRAALAQIFETCWADAGFKKRFFADPRTVLAEHGVDLPANLDLRIVENSDDCIHITLPRRPSGELDLEELSQVAGGFYLTLAKTGARSL